MSASKRSSPVEEEESNESSSAAQPPFKRPRTVVFEPIRLPHVFNVAELDQKTLFFQNQKLSERLKLRQKTEAKLRERIEQFERRQVRDDTILCDINRYWNVMDQTVRELLNRFQRPSGGEEYPSPIEKEESHTGKYFLTLLGTWDGSERDTKLSQRVDFSLQAISKLVRTFDELVDKNEKISGKIADLKDSASIDTSSFGLSQEVIKENERLAKENVYLQSRITEIQMENHNLSIEKSSKEDELDMCLTTKEELEKKMDDIEYEFETTQSHLERIESRLVESERQKKQLEIDLAAAAENQNSGENGPDKRKSPDTLAGISKNQMNELQAELDDLKDLTNSRLVEISDFKDKHMKALKEIEYLRMNQKYIPSELIKKSPDYECLQSQFTLLYDESVKIKKQLETDRDHMRKMRTDHLKQIEKMEEEELLAQTQLRQEMLSLEEQLCQVRREYEMLRLEFEQNLAANEQSGPLNREMRQLLKSYSDNNQLLKNESRRFKRKWQDGISAIAKLQKELDEERRSKAYADTETGSEAGESSSGKPAKSPEEGEISEEQSEKIRKLAGKVRELSEKCGKSNGDQSAELKRLKADNDRLVAELKGKGKTVQNDDGGKKIRFLEEQVDKLKKEIASAKAQETTLLDEMESTGQAFEDMQEQNSRLMNQLKERDESNLKLMSERIRCNQQQRKLKEEKDIIEQQITALQNQVEMQNLVIRKLEEKERASMGAIQTLETDNRLRQRQADFHKGKAMEYSQTVSDLKLHLEKLNSQLLEAQEAVGTKTSLLEEEHFRMQRAQEELAILRRKLDRAKKFEETEKLDEVLMEEIRELKECLTCPSCKVNRKDAVLSKCHHVFCMECINKRYETRRRKCPKCQAGFGANDFKRIYIS